MVVVVVLSDQPTPKVLVVPGVNVMRRMGKLGRRPIRSSECKMVVGKMNYLKKGFSTNGSDLTRAVLDCMHRTHLGIW